MQQIRRASVDYLARTISDGANLSEYEQSEDLAPEVETTLLAVWRRVLKEGSGPELTLPEAAVLLGSSVDSVRRRIKSGQIRAFYDERGRVRIVAAVTPPERLDQPKQPHEEAANLPRLWEELKATKTELDRSQSETAALRERLNLAFVRSDDMRRELTHAQTEAEDLQAELDNARHALEHTQGELASMWRVMSSRTERMEQGQRFGVTDGNEAFDLRRGIAGMSEERIRIQAQISQVRDLSRHRRRWPWPQAS